MKAFLSSIDDCKEVLALQKLSYRQEAEIYNDYQIPPLIQTIDQLKEEFTSSTVFKVTTDETIIGSVRAFLDNGICHIVRLIVHPDFQNKGIGSLLMNTVETYFENQGVHNFELFTGEKSTKNLYLYQKLGYKKFKTEILNENVNIVFLKK